MITRHELAQYLDDYLDCASFNDYAPNGLQIEGKHEISRLCTAVTASEEAINKAVDEQADALLVHHGFFWHGEDSVITGMKRKRIGRLMENNINLYAYHLPLDCHIQLGNNARLAELLNLKSVERHLAGKTKNLLWSGTLAQPMTALELSKHIDNALHRKPWHIPGTDKSISKIAWCSGAAQDFIIDAHRLEVDAYLSGEISERTYYQAKELGVHYFACGHHATERYGVQALGQYLASRFDLGHQFVDSSNPV